MSSKTLIQRVAAAMQEIAPLCLADRSWDNVGVLVENPAPRESNVVLLTIDLTQEVLKECMAENVSVIVAYHPVIFSPLKSLTLPHQEVVLSAVAAGMSVYCPHTSLDSVEGGINDWLAGLIDPKGFTRPIESITLTEADRRHPRVTPKCGIGRVLDLSSPLTLHEVVERVKHGLGLSHVRVSLPTSWMGTHAVGSVAICAGSGAGVFRKLSKQHVDVLLTGEMGHHEVLAARAAQQAVILCEHTNTERGYLKSSLEGDLQKILGNGVRVLTSRIDKDPLAVW